MRKIAVALNATLLVAPAFGALLAPAVLKAGQAAKQPAWKSREEYDAFQAMGAESNPQKKITLAEGVLQKYPNSDFKDAAYVQEMAAYQQLNKSDMAIQAAQNALKANPDNLDALTFMSFAFPFVYKADDPAKDTKLGEADANAKHGLEVLQKLQKPPNVTDEQFNQYVKPKRAVFNTAEGFVAVQKSDPASAITALKAAAEDNPSDSLVFSLLGQAYLKTEPKDYNSAIWYLARSASLAKAANSPNATALSSYYTKVYSNWHGSDQGEADILSQAAASVNPPAGFKVEQAPKHAKTGNAVIDGFYEWQDALKVGGDQEKQVWSQLKGQPMEAGGQVDGVEKGTDAGTYLVHIDLTDEAKGKDGVYDIELKDSQADCQYLKKGDLVRFKGTLGAYTLTPSFVITLDNASINQEDLDAAKGGAAKPKPKPPAHRPTRKS